MRWTGRSRNWLWPLVILAIVVAGFLAVRWVSSWFSAPPPTSIVSASLQSMREQQRLIVFSARYNAVVTSTQDRMGGLLSAQKTMIMPGDVRYELNLEALSEENLRWNAGTKTLTVTLPPLEVSQPQIDLNAISEVRNGSVLFALTGAERALDDANRQAALRSLAEQGRAPLQMRLARESAKRAIARSFALPLRAAGQEANVEVRFADEPQEEPSYMDRSRSMEEVIGRPVVVKDQK